MKPGISPELLKIARTVLSTLGLIAIAIIANDQAVEALGLAPYKTVLAIIFGVLTGKEALPRLGDVSPSKLQLEIERATSMRPPPPAEG